MNIVYNVESPARQVRPEYGIIKAEGWIFSPAGDPIDIVITLDRHRLPVTQGIIREDVRDAYPEEFGRYALYSGFSCIVEFTEKELKKDHSLKITAVNKRLKKRILLRKCLITPQEETKTALRKRVRRTWSYAEEYLTRKRYPRTANEWKTGIRKLMNLLCSGDLSGSAPGHSAEKLTDPYAVWQLKNAWDGYREEKGRRMAEALQGKIRFSVIMPVYDPPLPFLEEAIASVKAQAYTDWELSVADDCSTDPAVMKYLRKCASEDPRIRVSRTSSNSHISAASDLAVKNSTGEYLVMLDHDDLFVPDTLLELAKAIAGSPDADLLYSDDDKIGPEGELYDPQFKPDYSPELLLSYMYFGHVMAVKRSLFDKVGGFRTGFEGSQDHDLALRASEAAVRVLHIPRILYHWRATQKSTASTAANKPYSMEAGLKAVTEAVQRRNIQAEVYQPDFALRGNLGIYSLRYTGDHPLVSIVIPVKNRVELLRRCIRSIEEKTTYPNYEIIITDDGSDDPEMLHFLQAASHTVIYPEKPFEGFNYSWLVNRGVGEANGEYVILLNNDTEVIEPDWIQYLLVYMRMEGVGAAGAKLLYEDHRIQHAGVVLRMGNGIAGHAFKLLPDSSGGYLSYALAGRNYSAVTAACMMIRKSYYLEVGGFDEKEFSVSYNDVDYCLKLLKTGRRIVYSPNAVLYHFEGKSRGTETDGHYSDPAEEYRFYKKWLEGNERPDPYYNVNLSCRHEDFRINAEYMAADAERPLRVLLLSHNLNYEGAPLVQYAVAAELVRKGYSFTVLSMEGGLLKERYEDLGIPVYIGIPSNYRSVFTLDEFRRELETTIKSLKLTGFDLIYANTIDCYFGVFMGERIGCPVILGIHESTDYQVYFRNYSEDYLEEFMRSIRSAVKVLFVSEATASLYGDLCTHNFSVIHNGIDMKRIDRCTGEHDRASVREKLGMADDEFVVSVIGTVCERKGQIIFARAAKIIRDRYPEKKMKYLIVGARPSAYLDMVTEYISENGLDDAFRIIPYAPHEEIFDYYRASDVSVCCSFEESSPLVILEAIAFGVPVVATNVFGIPEIVRDGQDGLLVPPNDEAAVADGILKIAGDRKLAERLARSALYREKTFYTRDRMIAEYDHLMQSVAEEGRNRVYEKYYLQNG